MLKQLSISVILLMSCLVLKGQFNEPVLIDRNVELDESWEMCDFNNDGLLDIFTKNRFIYYQNQDGTIGTATELSAVNEIIAIGDINGDEVYDIFADDGNGGFYLHLNDGTGIFTQILLTDYVPDGVTLGDFDGNGLIDILIDKTNEPDLMKFQMTPGGTDFSTVIVSGSNATDHRSAPKEVYDSDNDGQDELWYLDNDNSLSTFFKVDYQLDGNMSRTEIMVTEQEADRFTIGDIDIDGIDELVLIDRSVNTSYNEINLHFHRKLSNGFFEDSHYNDASFQYESTIFLGNISVQDVDSDNLPDLILDSSNNVDSPFSFSNTIYLKNIGGSNFTLEEINYPGKGADINSDGKFDLVGTTKIYNYFEREQAPPLTGEYGTEGTSGFITLEFNDYNDDGYSDLFFEGYFFKNFYKLYLPDQKIFSSPIYIESFNTNNTYLGKLDLDNTNALDIYMSTSFNSKLSRTTYLGSGIYGPDEVIIDSISVNSHGVTLADLDNDGDKDVIGTPLYSTDDHYHWWKNNGSEFTLMNQVVDREDGLVRDKLWPVDIDNDGDLDLIKTGDGFTIFIAENQDGLGTFSESIESGFSESGSVKLYHVMNNTVGEVIAYGTRGILDIRYLVMFKLENNIFVEQVSYAQGSDLFHIHSDLTDIDYDGLPNLSYYDYNNTTLNTANIQNNGMLADFQVIHSNPPHHNFETQLGWSDYDNDGDYDLFYKTSNTSGWHENLSGTDNWRDRQTISNSSDFLIQQYLDIDNDQDIDMLGIHENRISWYENYDGNGNFGTEQIVGDLSETYEGFDDFLDKSGKIATADFDNNGTTDILAPNSQGKFDLFKNIGGEENLFPLSEKYTLYLSNLDIRNLQVDLFTPDDFPDLLAMRNGNVMFARKIPNFNNFDDWVTILSSDLFTTPSYQLNYFETVKIGEDYGRGVVGFNDNQLFYVSMTSWPLQLSDPIELNIDNQQLYKLDIEIGDIDGDGDDDIIAQARTIDDTQLYWWEQIDGTGTFAESQILIPDALTDPVFVSFSRDLQLIDINLDGKLDVISEKFVFLQLDNLVFAAPIELEINNNVVDLIFVDLNGDHLPEVIKDGEFWNLDNIIEIEEEASVFINTETDDDNISIWDMDENGTLDIYRSGNSYYPNQITNETPLFTITSFKNSYPHTDDYTIIDIDGDGFDNLVSHSYDDIAYWLQGVNYFNNPAPTAIPLGGYNPTYMDMDNDGDIDIISTGPTGAIDWQEDIDTWNSESILPGQNNFYLHFKALGDFNNDDFPDIVTIKDEGVYLLINQSGNGFDDPVLIHQADDDISTDKLVVTDLDNDGKSDIIFKHTNGEMVILYQQDNTTFQQDNISFGQRIQYLVRDLNQDQKNDIIYIINGSLNALLQTAPRVFTTSGQSYELATSESNSSHFYFFELADLDNDSDLDLIYKFNYGGTIGLNDPETSELYWAENVSNSSQISGEIFYDENQNGIRDTLEQGLQNMIAELSPENIYTYPASSGAFSFFVSPGNYTINHQVSSLWGLTTDTASYYISIPSDTITSQSGFDFGFYPNADLPDIVPTITSGLTRCNTVAQFSVEGINLGTQINSGTITFIKPPDCTITAFDIIPDVQIGTDTFIWNFAELYPSKKMTRKAFIKMPNEQSVGNLIPFRAITNFQDVNTDTTVNTIYQYNPVLLCAYDPNDKLVFPDRSGEENYTLFEESLEYTIRFQNTGNDTAFNIIIRDTLDPDLNWNTFQPLSSSHPYTVTRNDQGALAFDFKNIMLPDSNVNFITSQGFVKFLIDPNTGLDENTIIENTAHIYFDFNAPIVTNTIRNTMVSELPITSTENQDRQSFPLISLFPNPSSGIFNFNIPDEIPLPLTLRILDNHGREIDRLINISSRNVVYENSTLPGSIFFYQFLNIDHELLQSGKLIKH